MKRNINRTLISLLFTAAGLLGLALRLLVYTVATDGRGLLIPWSLPEILLWLLTAAAMGFAIPAGKGCTPRTEAGDTTGYALLLAGLIAQFFLRTTNGSPLLEKLYTVVLLLTLAAVGVGLAMSIAKKGVPFLCRAAVCVFFALNMLHSYSGWSEQTQLMHYCFSVLAMVCLTLFAFHQAQSAVDPETKNHSGLWALAGLYFCIVALIRCTEPAIPAAGAGWLLVKLLASKNVEAEA